MDIPNEVLVLVLVEKIFGISKGIDFESTLNDFNAVSEDKDSFFEEFAISQLSMLRGMN